MIKKKIKYVDFDENQREEDFYFNLSEAELTEMELSKNGGLAKILEKMVQEQDTEQIAGFFKDLILRSYGEKSNDGKHFTKSKEISDNFSFTGAYVKLYISLIKEADTGADFIKGIIPKGLLNANITNKQNGAI